MREDFGGRGCLAGAEPAARYQSHLSELAVTEFVSATFAVVLPCPIWFLPIEDLVGLHHTGA